MAAKMTPRLRTKGPTFDVEVRRIPAQELTKVWTLEQAVGLLADGYSVEYVVRRTGKDEVAVKQLARAKRIPFDE